MNRRFTLAACLALGAHALAAPPPAVPANHDLFTNPYNKFSAHHRPTREYGLRHAIAVFGTRRR